MKSSAGRFVILYWSALTDFGLSIHEAALLQLYCSLSNNRGYSYASIVTLARIMGLSKQTIRNLNWSLSEAELITIAYRQGQKFNRVVVSSKWKSYIGLEGHGDGSSVLNEDLWGTDEDDKKS